MYMPIILMEKKMHQGKSAYQKNGGKRIIEESVQDFGKRYANHALNEIDLSKKSGTVAWY